MSEVARLTAITALVAAGILAGCTVHQTGRLQEGSASGRFDGNTNIATRAEAIDRIVRAHPELRVSKTAASHPARSKQHQPPVEDGMLLSSREEAAAPGSSMRVASW